VAEDVAQLLGEGRGELFRGGVGLVDAADDLRQDGRGAGRGEGGVQVGVQLPGGLTTAEVGDHLLHPGVAFGVTRDLTWAAEALPDQRRAVARSLVRGGFACSARGRLLVSRVAS
jgi:hypothetical protein